MPSPLILVADTSVLINFLNIFRLDLLKNYSHQIIITDHVLEEVTGRQRPLLEEALKNEIIKEEKLLISEEEEALELYKKIIETGRIGSGESSAIAYAIINGHKVSLDDKRAIKEAKIFAPHLQVFRTEDLIISMIKEGLLDILQADNIKEVWRLKHKFHLNHFKSFSEIIESSKI